MADDGDRHRDRDQDDHGDQHGGVGDRERQLEADRHHPASHQQRHDREAGQHQPADTQPQHLVTRPVAKHQRDDGGDQAARHEQLASRPAARREAHRVGPPVSSPSTLRAPQNATTISAVAMAYTQGTARHILPGRRPSGNTRSSARSPARSSGHSPGDTAASTAAPGNGGTVGPEAEHVERHHQRHGAGSPGQRGPRRVGRYLPDDPPRGGNADARSQQLGQHRPEELPPLALGRAGRGVGDQPDREQPGDGCAQRQRASMRGLHPRMLAQPDPSRHRCQHLLRRQTGCRPGTDARPPLESANLEESTPHSLRRTR